MLSVKNPRAVLLLNINVHLILEAIWDTEHYLVTHAALAIPGTIGTQARKSALATSRQSRLYIFRFQLIPTTRGHVIQ